MGLCQLRVHKCLQDKQSFVLRMDTEPQYNFAESATLSMKALALNRRKHKLPAVGFIHLKSLFLEKLILLLSPIFSFRFAFKAVPDKRRVADNLP